MPPEIIDGKSLSAKLDAAIAAEISRLPYTPRLDVVIVGENPASKVYVRMKERACARAGISSVKHALARDTTEGELLALIAELNANNEVDGILVQLPLPKHISENTIISAIAPEKDVDGFHPLNMGALFAGNPNLIPCTPNGIIKMLDSIGFDYDGKHSVVVGRSNIVGKPMAMLLLQHNCTVTICHSHTKGLASETRRADLLVAAAGKPKLITADMVKEGAVVIDVGVNRTESGLVGDVDFDAVKGKASAISPVPGGVGPMTVAMLMHNTLKTAKERRK